MLRIHRNDVETDRVVLVLEGHILAEWADLLEQECEMLSRPGLRVDLDFSGVGFIGRSGLEALSRLAGAGVRIVGCSPLVADMLEQEGIAARRDVGDGTDSEASGPAGGEPDA